MITRFFRKNFIKKLFACLFWLLPTYFSHAYLMSLDKLFYYENKGMGRTYDGFEKGPTLKAIHPKADKSIFSSFYKGCQSLLKNLSSVMNNNSQKFEKLENHRDAITETLATAFSLQYILILSGSIENDDIPEKIKTVNLIKKCAIDIVNALENIKNSNNNQTGIDIIFNTNGKTYKLENFLVNLLDSFYKMFHESYDRYGVVHGMWDKSNEKFLLDKEKSILDIWNMLPEKAQNKTLITPFALAKCCALGNKDLFNILLRQGDKSHEKDEVYWLNKKSSFYDMNFGKHFFIVFLGLCYKTFSIRYMYKEIDPEVKEKVFSLINLKAPQKGINFLTQINRESQQQASPTAFVAACLNNEKDALFLLKKMIETYKNNNGDIINSSNQAQVIKYLNTTILFSRALYKGKDYQKNENALMAAIFREKEKKQKIKIKLIMELLDIEGIIVTEKHINYFNNNYQPKDFKDINEKNKILEKMEAKKNLALKNPLTQYEIETFNFCQNQIIESYKKIDDYIAKNEKNEDEIYEIREKNTELKNEVNNIKNNNTKLLDLINKNTTDNNQLKVEVSNLNNRISELKSINNKLKNQNDIQIKVNNNNQEKINLLNNQLNQYETDVNNLNNSISQLKNINNTLKNEGESQVKVNNNNQEKINLLNNQLNQYETNVNNLKNRISELENINNTLKNKDESQVKVHNNDQEKINLLKNQLSQYKTEVNKLKNRISELENINNTLKNKDESQVKMHNNNQEKINLLNNQLNQYETEVKNLNNSISQLKNINNKLKNEGESQVKVHNNNQEKINLLNNKLNQYKTDVNNLKNSISELENINNKLKNQVDNLKKQIEDIPTNHKNSIQENFEKVKKELESSKTDKITLEKENKKLIQKIDELTNQDQSDNELQDQLSKSEKTIKTLKKQIEDFNINNKETPTPPFKDKILKGYAVLISIVLSGILVRKVLSRTQENSNEMN